MAARERERKSPYAEAKVPLDMSKKQLYNSVKNGQRITFRIFDSDDVTGYLAGIDESYFFVLEPEHESFKKKIIRHDGSPVFEIHEAHSYEEEPAYTEMDEIIHKFRTWVMRRVFAQGPSVQSDRNDYDQRTA